VVRDGCIAVCRDSPSTSACSRSVSSSRSSPAFRSPAPDSAWAFLLGPAYTWTLVLVIDAIVSFSYSFHGPEKAEREIEEKQAA
jgi:hypothetical protein